MKKILLIIAVFAAFQATAQEKGPISVSSVDLTKGKFVSHTPESELRSFKNDAKKRGGTQYYRWLDFLASFEGISQATLDAGTFVHTMFPDSNVRINTTNIGFGVPWQSIGQVFHPQSYVINAGLSAGEFEVGNNAYTVDSVYLRGSYNKLSTAVDTMIVSVLYSDANNLNVGYFTGQASDFGSDTTRFARMYYEPTGYQKAPTQINRPGGNVPIIIKYPLTNNDSSNYTPGAGTFGIKTLGFPVNLNVPAGAVVAASFTFKPGYTYAVGDTVRNNNFFMFRSTEPNGPGVADAGTFMPYFPGDYNMSSVAYKDTSNGWFGRYIPTLAWSQTYAPEVHDIFWQITCATCGPTTVNDINKLEGVTIYPNPTSGVVNITLDNSLMNKDLNINIMDLAGKTIYTESFVGTTSVKSFNLENTAKGIYMYTVKSEGKVANGKLVIE